MSDLKDWFDKQETGNLEYEDFKPAYFAAVKASGDEANDGNRNAFEIARTATLATIMAYKKSRKRNVFHDYPI
jgi:hypothetical protein